jgi:hypothetical protein
MRRPGNLHGIEDHWFKQQLGATPEPKKILHPDIYQYSPHHISPNLRKGVTEVAEQIYTFDLFTPEFCKKLIEESEFQGGWKTGITSDGDGSLSGFGTMKLNINDYKSLKTKDEKDTTLQLSTFPKNKNLSLVNTVNKTSELHVKPLIEKLWQSFSITKYDMPYMLKYDPIHVKKMNLHYDLETVALIVYLNTEKEYEGGGTYFPRWNFRMQPQKAGQAAMWPGGVSHEHIGLPITKGLRYLLCCAYF